MDTPKVWDAAAGEAGKQAGMAQVDDATPEWWKAEAEGIIRSLIAKGEFSSDDVWAAGLSKEGINPKALGPVLRRFVGAGEIVASGRFHKTNMATRHRTPIIIWAPAGAVRGDEPETVEYWRGRALKAERALKKKKS